MDAGKWAILIVNLAASATCIGLVWHLTNGYWALAVAAGMLYVRADPS